MSSIPLIFAVNGWFNGFGIALKSVARFSPQTPVIVLGDAETGKHTGCTDNAPYRARADAFARVFVNCGPFESSYMMSCMHRWFVLHDYCQQHGIKRLWSLDWDVLTFCDLDAEAAALGDIPATLPFQQLYTSDISFMTPWLETVLDTYTSKPEVVAELNQRVLTGEWSRYGMCDYTLALWYYGKTVYRNLCDPVDGVASDGNISYGRYIFEVVDGKKRIEFRDGVPFCKLAAEDRWIRMRNLHFVGSTKADMAAYWQKSLLSWPFELPKQ